MKYCSICGLIFKSQGSVTSRVIIEGPPREYIATEALKAFSQIKVPTLHALCSVDEMTHTLTPLQTYSQGRLRLITSLVKASLLWLLNTLLLAPPKPLFKNYGANLVGAIYCHGTRGMLAYIYYSLTDD